MKYRWPMHVHLSTLFVAIFVVVAVISGVQRYRATTEMMESSAADLVKAVNREAAARLDFTLESATIAAQVLSRTTLPLMKTERERLDNLSLMQEALKASSSMVALYIGSGNGDMFMLRRLRSEAEETSFKAPKGTRYILQSIARDPKGDTGRFVYMDEQLNILREDDRPDYARSYDPRKRGWYADAVSAGDMITTEPYVFFTTGSVGLTIATPVENSRSVVGADIGLDTLGDLFRKLKSTPGTQIALTLPDGRLFAHEDVRQMFAASGSGGPRMKTLAESGIPVLQALQPVVAALDPASAHDGKLQAEGRDWRVSVTPLDVSGRLKLHLVLAIPDDELLAEALRQRNRSVLMVVVVVLLAIAVVMWASRRVSNPLRALAAEADRIRRFDFSQAPPVRSKIVEVDDLASTMDGMKSTIRRFLTLSEAVASEDNFDRLLPLLLGETLAAADAASGVLYLADAGALHPAAAVLSGGDASRAALAAPALQGCGPMLRAAVEAREPRMGRLGEDDRAALGLAAELAGGGDAQALAVPLLNRQRELVGCLLLLRATAFDAAQVSFIKALSGSAASSLETRELIKAQRALFEAFIQLIAGAIDAKSPYTGGHCERVPELTKMLARAACEQTEGPYRDFRLDDEAWEAVHVAGWLHDCGKITTPDFVVDKATKLETIHDRIHEVRMRFEVLKRDAHIACLQAQLRGEPAEPALERLRGEWQALDEDFAFVAACNQGGETMTEAQLQRLASLATRTWQRTLDDRLGISHEELQRKEASGAAPALPAAEPLLADKPEHRIARRQEDRLEPSNRWGFDMEVPEWLYDRGELHNLSVRRGTLTQEDRYKINEHIVQTIRMLSTLPFPKHLRTVPELAGGHHEKMDGSGYPRRLRREQMSPVARMMAIADVFEALTAEDRPYKRGKTLSEAIALMVRMSREAHIDPDLFALFLRSGVYLDYARRFLRPEMVDAVDVEQVLAKDAA